MALMPKRVKHRKSQRGRIKGSATRGNKVVFGDFGLQSLEPGWVKATTIEAGRIAAQQYVRGEGKLYIRIFPDKSVTSTPLETRMGKGKGEPDFWAAVVKPETRFGRSRNVKGPLDEDGGQRHDDSRAGASGAPSGLYPRWRLRAASTAQCRDRSSGAGTS